MFYYATPSKSTIEIYHYREYLKFSIMSSIMLYLETISSRLTEIKAFDSSLLITNEIALDLSTIYEDVTNIID